MSTDVLISGAGPAGAIAALVLARRGVRVTLVDRARFPREKLCGDTINPGALSILRRLGLERLTEGALPVRGMIVTGQGVAISRRVFDERLVAAAAAAGAQVEEGVLVRGPVLETTTGAVLGLELVTPSGTLERRAS